MNRVIKQLQCSCDYLGRGVTVAVLDSGVERHPDLDGRIVLFKDFISQKEAMYDDYGHGTHVCGIVAGDGKISKGKYRGIAPKAELIVGKILNSFGDGDTEVLLKALRWIERIQVQQPIHILNISISLNMSEQLSLQTTQNLLCIYKSLENINAMGTVITVAAGNAGPESNSVSKIGESDSIICVGCHDGDFIPKFSKLCETYSGRGKDGLFNTKPDIVAPGTEITSCNNLWKYGRKLYREPYITKSGTSMATAIVSGCLALLKEKEPGLLSEEIKKRVFDTAQNFGESSSKQGYGMICPMAFLA